MAFSLVSYSDKMNTSNKELLDALLSSRATINILICFIFHFQWMENLSTVFQVFQDTCDVRVTCFYGSPEWTNQTLSLFLPSHCLMPLNPHTLASADLWENNWQHSVFTCYSFSDLVQHNSSAINLRMNPG